MSHQNKLRRWLSADRLDVVLATLGLLVCLVLFGLRMLAEQVLLLVIPSAVATGCILYLGVQRRRTETFGLPTVSTRVIGYLPSVVFVGLAALVLATYAAGGRTVPVYLLTGAIGTAILAQILLVDAGELAAGLLIVQILVAAVVVRTTALFVTPGFVGVDIWTHVPVYIEGIVEAGSLSALSESKYSMAPLYHSIGAIAALVFGSARTGVYLTVGLVVPLSALFVYTTAKLFVPIRWALLAMALYAFADHFIQWGIHLIPTSLGVVFFLGVLYCLTRLFYTADRWTIGGLAAFSLATVFTHQVSTAIVLVLLGGATAAVLAGRLLDGQAVGASRQSAVGIVGTFVVTFVVTILSWIHTPWLRGEPFLFQILGILEGTLTNEAGFLNLVGGSGGGGNEGAENAGWIAELLPFLEWFGFALLLSAAVLGSLTMIRRREPIDATWTYLLTASMMFVIVFGFSLFGIRDILPGRWMGFMYALFAVLSAIGLYHLSRNAPRRVLVVVLVVVAVGYPTTMVVAEKATLDSPAFEEEYVRFSYTESEIAAVETISTVYPAENGREVGSDHPYQTLFARLGGYSSDLDFATVEESGVADTRPTVYREYQNRGPASVYTVGAEQPVSTRTIDAGQLCPPDRNHVYANDEVKMCSPVPEPSEGET